MKGSFTFSVSARMAGSAKRFVCSIINDRFQSRNVAETIYWDVSLSACNFLNRIFAIVQTSRLCQHSDCREYQQLRP